MADARKPHGVVRIIVSEDSGAFWVKKGKVSQYAHDYEAAMNIARRLFLAKGGEGKAVIIDLTRGGGDAT